MDPAPEHFQLHLLLDTAVSTALSSSLRLCAVALGAEISWAGILPSSRRALVLILLGSYLLKYTRLLFVLALLLFKRLHLKVFLMQRVFCDSDFGIL